MKYLIVFVSVLLLMSCAKDEEQKINQAADDFDPVYQDIEDFTISPNAESYGFSFIDDQDRNYIYGLNVNGRYYGPFEYLWGPVFTFEGDYFAYLFDKDQETYFYYKNNNYGPYQNGFNIAVSSNGNSFAFSYISNRQNYVRYNNEILGPYDWVQDLRYSGHSNCTFIYQEDGNYNLSKNGKTVKLDYLPGDFSGYSVSFNGRRYSYLYSKSGMKYLYIDGTEYGPYEEVWPAIFSENGEKFIICSRLGEDWFLMLDDIPYGPYDSISEITLSHDGSRYAYVAQDNWEFSIYLDSKLYGTYSAPADLMFSRDNQSFAFSYLKSGEKVVVLNGKEYGPYSGAGFRFTAENRFAIGYVLQGEVSFYSDISELDTEL